MRAAIYINNCCRKIYIIDAYCITTVDVPELLPRKKDKARAIIVLGFIHVYIGVIIIPLHWPAGSVISGFGGWLVLKALPYYVSSPIKEDNM